MSRIVVDPALGNQFATVEDPAEICDSDGRVLAYAVTPEWHRRMMYAWAMTQMPDTHASAVDEYEKEGGMTIADVREYLASLANGAQP